MSTIRSLRRLISQRLTEAAEEILSVFEETIVKYEDELARQRRLLVNVWEPEIKLHRIELPRQHVYKEEDQQGFSQETDSTLDPEDQEFPRVKEEVEEPCTSQDGETLVLKQEADACVSTAAFEQSLCLNTNDTRREAEDESANVRDESSAVPEPDGDPQLASRQSHGTERCDQKAEAREGFLKAAPRRAAINSDAFKGKKSVKCDACGKTFKSVYQLNIHFRIHTGEKPYSCAVCGKDFRHKHCVMIHMRTHTGEKPYSCTTCGKRFMSSSGLVTHMRVHTGERPFPCTTCGKAFRYKHGCLIHMRTHTGEKPYFCKTCGRTFSDVSVWKRHASLHTGENPYSCQICGKAFRPGSACKIHTRAHVREKPYVCNTCGKRFSYLSNYEKHARVHAGEKATRL